MTALSPKQSAAIARHVYTVRGESTMGTVLKTTEGLGLEGQFTVDDGSRFTGHSGGHLAGRTTGFGYLAKGIGPRQGEALVAIRGTDIPADWLTDMNIGLQRSCSGWPVHAGFNTTFKSFAEELRTFFGASNPSRVHCVGHSLGGALATLAADWLRQNEVAEVSLYTFGCPRVGALGFGQYLTQRLKAENIYRVYHDADPVSMIPVFPFRHLPDPGQSCHLQWAGARVAVPAHLMQHYEKSLGDSSWQALKALATQPDMSARVKSWLKSSSGDGAMMLSAKALWMISKALLWLLKESALCVVGGGLTLSFTVLDHLVALLHQGTLASARIAEYLGVLIRRILEFLGRTAETVAKLTATFIRWVLDLLFSTLSAMAHLALSREQLG